MKEVYLQKENLNENFFKDVLFFMFSEGGAMGTPGEIRLIKKDNVLYKANYIYGGFTWNEFETVFPAITKCKFGLFGNRSKTPKGWKYVDLGAGNHLVVSSDIYAEFYELIKNYKNPGRIYQNWIAHADSILNSKGDKKMEKTKTANKLCGGIQKPKDNNITELVFILDRSGSMSGLESDTIGGFNAMIKKQREEDGECFVSTVLFDNVSEVLHDRIKLSDVPEMTDKDYTVRGCTALIDALGGAIHHIGNIHKYARPEDVPENTMFIITTDGMENASHRYSSEQVKKMIERQKSKYGWEFLFIGANIDAVETAGRYGIAPDRAVNYHADEKGTGIVYETVANAVCTMRTEKKLNSDWGNNINEDYRNRKK